MIQKQRIFGRFWNRTAIFELQLILWLILQEKKTLEVFWYIVLCISFFNLSVVFCLIKYQVKILKVFYEQITVINRFLTPPCNFSFNFYNLVVKHKQNKRKTGFYFWILENNKWFLQKKCYDKCELQVFMKVPY